MRDYRKYMNPAFLLRRIDFINIKLQYEQQKYSHVTLKYLKNLVTESKKNSKQISEIESMQPLQYIQSQQPPDLGSIYNEGFLMKNHLAFTDKLVTTNHYAFDYFQRYQKMPEGGVCEWDRHPFDGPICGIPISHKIYYNKEEEEKEKKHWFDIDGCFCSWQCAYAFLVHDRGLPCRFNNIRYTDSEQLLFYLWSLLPREKPEELKESNSYRLIEPYGPLKLEEYRENLSNYRNERWLIYAPVKEVYMKLI